MAVESTRNNTSIPKGGTVRVEQGMTLYSISRANGLSVAQLAAANNIEPPYRQHRPRSAHPRRGSGSGAKAFLSSQG